MKQYETPQVKAISIHAESGILVNSPIGVEAAKVTVDEHTEVIGGDAIFEDENLFN